MPSVRGEAATWDDSRFGVDDSLEVGMTDIRITGRMIGWVVGWVLLGVWGLAKWAATMGGM